MKRWTLLAAAAATSACLFPSLAGLSGDTDTGSDATGAADADASAEGGWVLVGTYDFESSGCGPFANSFGTAQTVTTSHGGSSACEACFSGGSYFTLDPGFKPFVFPVAAGESYVVRTWFRVGETTTDPMTGTINVRVFGPADGGMDYTSAYAMGEIPLDASYRELQNGPFTATTSGTGLNVYLEGHHAEAGDCFIVDDIAVYRVPDGG